MYRSRLNEIPTLKSLPGTVDAARFNRVRLALSRLENPLRLELPGLRSMDFILENQVWAIVDRNHNDIPVVAWTDFEPRETLHEPVHCIMRIYHLHADAIIDQALHKLDNILEARLKNKKNPRVPAP
jgi:hypothetical protein